MPKICKICQSQCSKSTKLKNGKVFWHCLECGFSFLDPEFFLSPEEEKARYDLHENSIENEGYVKMFEAFIDFAIKPYSVSKILDFGSGPEPVLAKILEKNNYSKISTYDPFYQKNEIEERDFDMVVSTEVFEHFFDPQKEIKRVIELIKPGAYLALMTRFNPGIDKFKSWFYKDDPTHVSFYSITTFEKIAEKFNLSIVKHDNFEKIIIQKNYA